MSLTLILGQYLLLTCNAGVFFGGWRKLLLYVSNATAAIFEFVSEGDGGG